MSAAAETPLLDVEGLRTTFPTRAGLVTRGGRRVAGRVERGECLGVVGESGLGQERHLPQRHGAGASAGPRRRRASSSSTGATCARSTTADRRAMRGKRHRHDHAGRADGAQPGASPSASRSPR